MTTELTGITAYKDICIEIEILKLRAEDQERSLKYARRMMHNNGFRSDGGVVVMPLDKALGMYDEALTGLQVVLEELRCKEQTRQLMEAKIGEIEGLEMAVEYQRDALGLPLAVIADRLGYSLGHIKNVSSRIPRRRKMKSRRK